MVGEAGENLVFVLGVPRSGTTLLCALLAGHERVLCPPEPWVMLALESLGSTSPSHPADAQVIGRAFRDFTRGAPPTQALRRFATDLYNQRLDGTGKSVLVDKTPRYYHILPFIERLFPEAKFVWLKRDPFDIAASYQNTWGIDLADKAMSDPGDPASLDLLVGLPTLEAFASEHKDRVHALRYEDLVRDADAALAGVYAFLGLAPAPAPERPADTLVEFKGSPVGDKKILETAGVHSASVGTGLESLSGDQLESIYSAVGVRTLKGLGYASTLDALKRRGISEPKESSTKARRLGATKQLEQRWSRVDSASDIEADLPPSLRYHLDEAERRFEGMRGHAEALEGERDTWIGRFEEQKGEAERERKARYELVRVHERLEHQFQAHKDRGPRAIAKELARKVIDAFIVRIARERRGGPLPPITLVTPCFNAADTIRETIESVLAQGYPNLQYIIVDGASTDSTMDIVREYEDKLGAVISEPDGGMYDAVGKGFDRATGEVLMYLNADDVLEPRGLERVGEHFRDHPKSHVAYREDTITIGPWRFPNAAQPPRVDMFSLLNGHILFQDGVAFRKNAYRQIGGVDRTMRLAGDYDLWLRLSRHFRFDRVHGHVSSFRIRAGQLSTDMDAYGHEQRQSRARFKERMRLIGWVRRVPGRLWTRAVNATHSVFARRRFFYPVCFAGQPAPGDAPDPASPAPSCPLTGRPMDRLLFTSRDTRFECPLVSSVYYNDASGVAVTWPRLEGEQLNELYETYYSSAPGEPIAPPEGLISPYRGWYDKRWVLGRIVRKLEAPFRVQQVINHRAESGTWGQITWRDLKGALGGRVRADDSSVRFLDAGCFEGEVLDELREQTSWRLSGLEPNTLAVAKARDKGHTIFEAFVEDAVSVIPETERFDVIFLGQVIEHVNDPPMVVRRLTQLLKPGGLLVLSTPNLDSAQARMFGPTWSHWHLPYHRVLFGIKSMRELGRVCALKTLKIRTHSNSFWSGYSVKVNELGVAGSAPHTWHPDPKTMRTARSISAWSRLLWNWRGKGDYLFAVYRKI